MTFDGLRPFSTPKPANLQHPQVTTHMRFRLFTSKVKSFLPTHLGIDTLIASQLPTTVLNIVFWSALLKRHTTLATNRTNNTELIKNNGEK